ncbi:Uncharacterised protein [Enterobacter cloacae]|nr:Uncharacterised protein [Enterobacter cloacae]
MADGNWVTRRTVAGDADLHGAFRPRAHVRRRDRRAPGAVCQHRCGIVFPVDGHGQRGAWGQPVAGAGDNQILVVLNGVDHIIARHGVHTQARQVGVDGDVTFARTGVAVAVGDGRAHAQTAVAECGQNIRRHAYGPAQIALHRRGVAVAANRHGYGVARFGIRHGAADGLACRHFRRVNHVVARHGVDDDGWQCGVDQQVRTVAHVVAHAVGGGRVQGVVRLTQTRQIGGRNRQAPGTVCRCGGRVVFTVQGHGHHGAFCQVGAGAADAQILAFLHRVQDVVIADSVEINRRQTGIDGHTMGAGAGIARRVSD